MVRMRYAYNPNGEIVHVDQVCRGRRDGCTCIECHEPVEAHQGQIRAHYYSHCKNTACPGPSKDKIRKLTTVSESQIHAYAKKIISRNSIIAAPVVSCDLSPLLEHPLPLYPPKKIDLHLFFFNFYSLK